MSTGWTVVGIIEALQAREVTCTELVVAALERGVQAHDTTGCFVDLDHESAVARAELLDGMNDEQRRARPLFGVPYGFKDVFMRDGREPGVGQHRSRMRHRATQAQVLTDADAAGAVAVGSLSLDPLAYATTGLNDDLGDTLNPWDTSRVPGGSSAGAAVAVATGALPVAIGADTGGSVRIPAALCGVVGMKPTYGRISRRGVAPVSYSQDAVGIVARTVRDVACVLGVLAGYDPADPGSIDAPVPDYRDVLADAGRAPLTGLRVGVDEALVVGAEMTATLVTACEVLAGLGARLVAVDLGAFTGYDTAAGVLTWTEVMAVHGSSFREHRGEYPDSIRARLDTALMAQPSSHVDAQRLQGRALREMLHGALTRCDVIATPTTAGTAPPIAGLRSGELNPDMVNLDFLSLNRPYSFLGLPSMSVPMGFAADGLPMGMQLAGRPWSEPTLLRAGAAYQSATEWHTRRPSLLERI